MPSSWLLCDCNLFLFRSVSLFGELTRLLSRLQQSVAKGNYLLLLETFCCTMREEKMHNEQADSRKPFRRNRP